MPGPVQVSPQQAALDAYAYGIPLMEFNRVAAAQTSVTVPDAIGDAPVNQFGNARILADPRERVIVQPNNDTLYSLAHLDLSRTALVLHVPAIAHHRYFAFEFLDPYTNVFAYVGTRTTGEQGGTFLITGPGFRGRVPHGMRRIHSPYARTWIVGRTLVVRSRRPRRRASGPEWLRAHSRWPPTDARAWPGERRGRTASCASPASCSEPTGLAFFDALGQRPGPQPAAGARRRDPARAAHGRRRGRPASLARASQRADASPP